MIRFSKDVGNKSIYVATFIHIVHPLNGYIKETKKYNSSIIGYAETCLFVLHIGETEQELQYLCVSIFQVKERHKQRFWPVLSMFEPPQFCAMLIKSKSSFLYF